MAWSLCRASERSFFWVLGCLLGCLALAPVRGTAGSITRDLYLGIPGSTLSALTGAPTYPNSPSSSTQLTGFLETPSNSGENYGQRLRGFVVPPVTGNYRFWIASDDASTLYLSSDLNPGNKQALARVDTATNPREWERDAVQRSGLVFLEASRAYYIEVLMKEGTGSDHLAVRWLRPDGVDEGPIPTTYLLPANVDFTAPKFVQQPQNVTAAEGRPVRFQVSLDPTGPATVAWYRNDVLIPGAESLFYEIPAASSADTGASFKAIASNGQGTATSSSAVLTVGPEDFPPVIVRAYNVGETNLLIEFNEPVQVVGGTLGENFRLDGGLVVSAQGFDLNNTAIVLTTTPMKLGAVHTLTLGNIRDRSPLANAFVPNGGIKIQVAQLVSRDIGNPAIAGSIVQFADGLDITGGGSDIGGRVDQFHFAWERRAGDFDLQTRVEGATLADAFLHAGLMVRDSFENNSRFAAVFASSVQVGCFFESRASLGGSSSTVSPTGGFPVNYPNTWLRLRRVGAVIEGFASHDGLQWTLLSSVTLDDLPNPVFVGLAVTGQNPQLASTVRFRGYRPTASTVVAPLVRDTDREPLGPSSRSTGLVVSEIMYHPLPGMRGSDSAKSLEYVELYNAGAIFEDLTGYRITGGIEYGFPQGFLLQPGAFVVIASDPDAVKAAYGLNQVLGPYLNRLGNDAGVIQVKNEAGAIVLDAVYDSTHPWPASADGAGHSLVLARPSWGEGHPMAWAASERVGGSPGEMDAAVSSPLEQIVLNELLAHTDEPQLDYIELHNRSNVEVDLSGCILTDDPTTNRFRIPAGTKLGARSQRSFDQNALGFRLDAAGETLFLIDPHGTRVLDSIRFGAQQNGVAYGRSPDGSPTWRRLSIPTPDSPNAAWKVEDLVINELMYDPIGGDSNDEYVELYNRSNRRMDLKGWRFTSGVEFEFPEGARIEAGGYFVIAKDRARLLSNHPTLAPAIVLGDYAGSLGNRGDHVALAFPDQIVRTNELGELKTNVIHIVVAETRYTGGGRWGKWSAGGGSSMELIDPHSDPLRAANWADSDESEKAVWESVSTAGRAAEPVSDANRFFVTLLGPGESLVDDVELVTRAGVNLLAKAGNFEASPSGWSFFGTHDTSTIDTVGAASGLKCLHIRSVGDGDTGPNSIRTPITTLASGTDVTLRAKVRWVAGWPEMLFRVRGTPFEYPVKMTVPKNLGTPGAVNSRFVPNAGPAIFDVTHWPALPKANEPVVVTARVSDPDGITSVSLRLRVDSTDAQSTVSMVDNGTGADAVAGDGIYSGTISGRSNGTIMAFRVEATDAAGTPILARFPADAPRRECLVRFGDTVPFGSLGHYHMWNTRAVDSPRGNALNNTYRDCTLVYNNYRVVYNAGFRDKGSPFHGGGGDYAVTVPEDDLVMGVTDRVFGSTGNGGSEATGIRGRVTSWIARRMGLPYLYAHPIRVWRNGGLHRNISEDLEQPNNHYAEARFPGTEEGDLYKIAIWFEFDDGNGGFSSLGANLSEFKNPDGSYRLGRYRYNFQTRGFNRSANNYSNLFNLARAANSSASTYVGNMMNLVDMDQWMRVFVFNRILGNWDSYGFNISQNMFIYKRAGERWKMLPWDLDFVLGDGNSSGEALWTGAADATANRMHDTPAFRRMFYRAYFNAANTLLTTNQSNPQIDLRREVLLNNGITGLGDVTGIKSYISGRRRTILNAYAAADAKEFAITTSNGADFTSTSQTATLEGTAKIEVVDLEVNGIQYPVEWYEFTRWRLRVPLANAVNDLVIRGLDRDGQPIASATDTITVRFNGALADPASFIAINEVQYNPAAPNASFIELANSSANASFNLSGWRLEGVGYTFPEGSIMAPNSFLILAKDRAGFELAHGAGILVYDVFPGSLDNGGESLRLVRPGVTPDLDVRISDVRYDDRLPWPVEADGTGASLQLIDPSVDAYRVANWAVAPAGSARLSTPGSANTVRQSLTAFPFVWLNEVQPNNVSGPSDNTGEREPWIELYNSGATAADLSGLYLTDSYTNLTQWAFPAGTTLEAKSFLRVWMDGEIAESAPGHLHAGFRLNGTKGSIALVRLQGSPAAPAVIDYVDYDQVPPNRSMGSIPDGEPRSRRSLYFATPEAPNNPAFPQIQVTVNEFMAENTSTIKDPADGKFSDWFELYNEGDDVVDLTGYSLTDSLLDPRQFVIPSGYVLQPKGFLLVWADGDTKQNVATNSDLHVSFRLDTAGEQLGLFGPDGVLVDGLTFGAQVANVSEGRVPDGGALPLAPFESPTPGAGNFSAGANLPPILTRIGDRLATEQVLLNFTPTAVDPEGKSITWSLSVDAPSGASIDPGTGQFTWTPSEEQGPGVYTFFVRATDSGAPPRTAAERIRVTVEERNRTPVIDPILAASISEGSPYSFQVVASDPDVPANTLVYTLGSGAPKGASIDSSTGGFSWTPAESDGPGEYSFQVIVTDSGSPAISSSQSMVLRVIEVDNPPVFDPLTPQQAVEGRLFTYTVHAVDGDTPPAEILYSFDKSPPGATIDSTTGEIQWTPTELDGPGNFVFVVRATERSGGLLSEARSFGVAVAESNTAPVLAPIQDVIAKDGTLVQFAVTASDTDLPGQTLTYSIVSGGPAGASLDPASGMFSWVVPDDTLPSTNVVTIAVVDNGPGNLQDSRSFKLVVEPRFRVVINEIMYRAKAAGAEYVELFNPSAINSADLSGLLLASDNCNFTFPAGTLLGPKAFLTVVGNPTAFRAAYGPGPVIVGPWQGTLGGRGTLGLYLLSGNRQIPLSRITYDRTAPWPVSADGGGSSLQLIDASRDTSRPGNWSATVALSGPRTLVALTNDWRYFQQGAPPSQWNEPAFVDTAWSTGGGALYVENANLQVPKTTALTLGQISYYFRTRFLLPVVPTGAILKLRHAIDDGAVFYLNGKPLFRFNMADGPVTAETLSSATVGDAALSEAVVVPADALVPGENVLAVQVHQASTGSSDIVMAAELVLDGGILPALTPGAPNNVIASLPVFPTLRINEVMPINATGLRDAAGDRDPWIELYNDGETPVDVSGLFLTDDPAKLDKWVFPSARVLQPGGFLTVFADNEPLETTPSEFHTNFRLTQTPGASFKLVLSRMQLGSLAAIDEFAVVVPAADSSFTRFPDGDTSTGVASTLPTPGSANDIPGANRRPVFVDFTPQDAFVGSAWSLAVLAKDSDVPAQTLSYSLVTAPNGALIGTSSGLIEWTPNGAQLGSQRFVVRVTDSGSPSMASEREFWVLVRVPPSVEMSAARVGEVLRVEWISRVGAVYRLESRPDVGSGDWILINSYNGTGGVLRVDIPLEANGRFYRLVEP